MNIIDWFACTLVNLELTSTMGTFLSFVQAMRNNTWLHHADVSRNQLGSSNSSVSTRSSSSKSCSSPSPRNVLTLILSDERFFVYLLSNQNKDIKYVYKTNDSLELRPAVYFSLTAHRVCCWWCQCRGCQCSFGTTSGASGSANGRPVSCHQLTHF